jgi:nucleoid-associated protein YgaU
MRVSRPVQGLSFEWRGAILCGVLLAPLFTIPSYAQDVADAARQEQARKAADQKSSRHVYTEEDLQRPVILTPEDQAHVEARKQATTPTEQNAKQEPNDGVPLSESLGEIARRYRQAMASHEAELATQKKITPFPYKIQNDPLAEPNIEVVPLAPPTISSVMGVHSKPSVPNLLPRSVPHVNGSHRKISPFQPRPLNEVSPAAPVTIAVTPSLPSPPAIVATPAVRNVPPIEIRSATRRIEVQRGQSWWKLAELYLGNGARWGELRKLNANAGGPPELLKLGTTVLVPEIRTAEKNPTQAPVKVKKGDSLWSVARAHLGKGSAWNCLAIANPQIVNFTHLAIGTSLRLPSESDLKPCTIKNSTN